MLSTDSSYREVEPYLVPLGQASSGAYVAGGERRGCDAPACLACGTYCLRARTERRRRPWSEGVGWPGRRGACLPERDLTRPLSFEMYAALRAVRGDRPYVNSTIMRSSESVALDRGLLQRPSLGRKDSAKGSPSVG
jgi:hypothetical protein